MKKFIIVCFLFICVLHQYNAQYEKPDKEEYDTLLNYVEGQKEYTFFMNNGRQVLYVDSINTWKNGFYINVVNNTLDTLTYQTKTKDCAITWFQSRVGSNSSYSFGDEILPGDTVGFRTGFARKAGAFKCPLRFRYELNDSMYQISFKVIGRLYDIKEDLAVKKQIEEKKPKKEPKPKSKTQPQTEVSSTIKYVVYEGDTVNRVNISNKKVGLWVTFFYKDTTPSKKEYYPDPARNVYNAMDLEQDSLFIYHQNGNLNRVEYYSKYMNKDYQYLEYYFDGTLKTEKFWNGLERGYYDTGELHYTDKKTGIDTIPVRMVYYKSGQIASKTYRGGSKFTYDENGNLIAQNYSGKDHLLIEVQYNDLGLPVFEKYSSNRNTRYAYTMKNDTVIGKITFGIPSKNVPEAADTVWIDEGIFKGGEMIEGVRRNLRDKSRFSNIYWIENGEKVGYVFNGEVVNLTDSLGKKQGKWINLHWNTKIIHVESYYADGRKVDTTFVYTKASELVSHSYEGLEVEIKRKDFYPGGRVKSIHYNRAVPYHQRDTVMLSYYLSGKTKEVQTRTYTDYYSEENQECPKIRKYSGNNMSLYKSSLKKNKSKPYDWYSRELYEPFEQYQWGALVGMDSIVVEYKDCKMSSKTYPRYLIVEEHIEGQRMRVKQSYRKEKGTFVTMLLYNGVIEYYNKEGVLIKTTKVVDGKEVE